MSAWMPGTALWVDGFICLLLSPFCRCLLVWMPGTALWVDAFTCLPPSPSFVSVWTACPFVSLHSPFSCLPAWKFGSLVYRGHRRRHFVQQLFIHTKRNPANTNGSPAPHWRRKDDNLGFQSWRAGCHHGLCVAFKGVMLCLNCPCDRALAQPHLRSRARARARPLSHAFAQPQFWRGAEARSTPATHVQQRNACQIQDCIILIHPC